LPLELTDAKREFIAFDIFPVTAAALLPYGVPQRIIKKGSKRNLNLKGVD
jgi:hypothetical protein